MNVSHNIQARSFNYFCSRKAIIITLSVRVFVPLGIQHAMRMRHAAICVLPGFFDIISQAGRFPKKGIKIMYVF
jgi:hypothetical protein